jgi:translation initiation factor eIF-2B subunit epsilon
VLRRWVFPLVPDLNEPGGTQYELRRGNVYVAKDEVKLARYVLRTISLEELTI